MSNPTTRKMMSAVLLATVAFAATLTVPVALDALGIDAPGADLAPGARAEDHEVYGICIYTWGSLLNEWQCAGAGRP